MAAQVSPAARAAFTAARNSDSAVWTASFAAMMRRRWLASWASAGLGSIRAVSWWSVHEYVAPTLAAAVEWPMAGTPAWCDLDDTDPVKWAAICDAARHWALRVETCQAASAEASRDVSAAADWPAVSREIQRRRDAYIRRVVV